MELIKYPIFFGVNMINSISSVSSYTPIATYRSSTAATSGGGSSLLNFDKEDQAIISSEAKMLNALDQYNSGEGSEIDLALTNVMAKHQVGASIQVIKSKNEMVDSLMEAFDS